MEVRFSGWLARIVCGFLFLAGSSGAVLQAQEWPWRGPSGNGVAADGQQPPLTWDETTNVVWKVEVPGRGHSSPVVAGERIFLTTADEAKQTQSVLCFDLATGRQLWNTECNSGGFLENVHRNNTHASSTVAVGDGRVFAVFCARDAVQVAALDLDGKLLWNRKVCAFVPTKYEFGFAASPIYHAGRLIVTSESETEPVVLALDPADGKEVWRIERPEATSYSTPVVTELNGRPQLMLSGGQKVVSYDPESGKQLWETRGSWLVTCGTMVWNADRSLVYASGGYPSKQTMAVKTDGSGEIAWSNKVQCYEQSLLVAEGCVYGFAEGGLLNCWDAETGQQLWVHRLKGGESASPVLAGGHIFITNERGTTWVLRPNREMAEIVATNQLGDETFASLAVVNNRILLRAADSSSGERRETLYCLGKQE